MTESTEDQIREEISRNVDSGDWDSKLQDCWVDRAMEQIMNHEHSVVLAHDIQSKTVKRVGTFIAKVQKLPDSSFVRYSEALG